jgi:2-polyprenyl-6-methoxyphenol hydroxylase-like FAD-dependent oxidoreductase
MGEKLRDYGINVQWNTELVALDQQPDHVNVTLKQPDETMRTNRVTWVAGCDGSRSAVREMSGITGWDCSPLHPA